MDIAKKEEIFYFKQFEIRQDRCTMKVGTDGVLLGAWIHTQGPQKILDIGTGTGLIAIMLAQRNAEASIVGVEIDEDAFAQAQDNMKRVPWNDRLQVVHSPVQLFSKTTDQKFDLIVSNPPFFSGGTFSENQDRQSVRHTVKLPHGELLDSTRKLLTASGKLCVILPYIEGTRFIEMAARYGFYPTRMTQVKPRKQKPVERLLLQFERQPNKSEPDELVIMEDANYTDDYQHLTKEFYLKM